MTRKLLPLVAALVASLMLAAPAHAQLTITKDAKGDGHFKADFKKVTVDHTEKRVRFNTRMFNKLVDSYELPDEVWHLVDTQGDREPEFLVFVTVKNEVDPQPAVSITRVKGWPPKKKPYRALFNGDSVDCGLHVAHRRDGGRLLKTVIGRGCLSSEGAKPTRLRVSTFGTLDDGRYTDFVKGWKKYGAWVSSD